MQQLYSEDDAMLREGLWTTVVNDFKLIARPSSAVRMVHLLWLEVRGHSAFVRGFHFSVTCQARSVPWYGTGESTCLNRAMHTSPPSLSRGHTSRIYGQIGRFRTLCCMALQKQNRHSSQSCTNTAGETDEGVVFPFRSTGVSGVPFPVCAELPLLLMLSCDSYATGWLLFPGSALRDTLLFSSGFSMDL
ncbi:hypothetical protein GN956_G1301 [Arapaima gigas]